MGYFANLIHNGFIGLVIDKSGEGAAAATQAAGDAAATAAAQPAGMLDIVPTILMWGGLFAAMYFFLIRPQRKRDKQQKEMQAALKVGDNVLTTAGFYGKIVSVGNDAFVVEFGDNRGVRVPVRKSDVLGVKTPDMSPPSAELEIEDKKEDKKDKKEKDNK